MNTRVRKKKTKEIKSRHKIFDQRSKFNYKNGAFMTTNNKFT